MKATILTLTMAALAVASAPAQTTTRLTATKANDYGLIYTLPLTEFKVTIAAEKTVRTPGEFYQYAKKYLADTPVTTPSTSWRITSVVVNPAAYADDGERYSVTLKGSGEGEEFGVGLVGVIVDGHGEVGVTDGH